MAKNRNILLTWDAHNNGFIVTVKMLALLIKEKVIIDEIYYFHEKTLQKSNRLEMDCFNGTKTKAEALIKNPDDNVFRKRLYDIENIKEQLEKNPKLINRNIEIKSVTDYQSIFNSLATFIKDHFYKSDNVLHVNVSPGTPQMHVVWLMLNSAGYLPENTVLWSTQYIKKSGKTILEKINFKPHTYISEVLQSKYKKYLGPEINPNETRSGVRKSAEQNLMRYALMPNCPLLILGERGVGKSSYVRNFLKQKGKPYQELVCGTFSEELIRSELFGHEAGAFTGALKKKDGILAKFKEGGLLFLDEIHDLSKPLQRQLMQVLQTGVYYPVGSSDPAESNLSLVSASNLDLKELREKIDGDFFDRIARFVVEIPPLRECRTDLENYWGKAWKEVGNFDNAPDLIWNTEIEKYFNKSELLGNFRDLQRLASTIMVHYIDTKDRIVATQRGIKEIEKLNEKLSTSYSKDFFKENSSYSEIMADFELDLAKKAIDCYGNKKNAALKLGISESKLNKDLAKDRLKREKKK